jgi:hypothetical protein
MEMRSFAAREIYKGRDGEKGRSGGEWLIRLLGGTLRVMTDWLFGGHDKERHSGSPLPTRQIT